MASAADADFFAAQWGLDEASRHALLQLDPDLQVKVITDFSPKPGTRDVNRLFHGFIKSVRTSALVGGGRRPPPAEVLEAASPPETALAGGGEEKLSGSSWHVQTDTIDVEAFVSRWGLDAAAHTAMLDQSPAVQARVMAEFSPKPGTRDVNRLFAAFIRSVRNTPGGRATAAVQLPASADESGEPEAADRYAAVAQEEDVFMPDEVFRYTTDENMVLVEEPAAPHATQQPFRAGAPQRGAASGAPPFRDVPSFIAHWGLDAAAQAALLQLSQPVQAQVLADFAPKPGTRDVQRLFHGFIMSVQLTHSRQAAGAEDARAPAAQPGYAAVRAALSSTRPAAAASPYGYTMYRPPSSQPPRGPRFAEAAPAAARAPAAQAAAAAQLQPTAAAEFSADATARLQAFVDHWGLDAGSVTALVQLPPDTQTTVVTEFAPKPNTQDVNRLFRGWIRSIMGSRGERPARVYTIINEDVQPTEEVDLEEGYAAYSGAPITVEDPGSAGEPSPADEPVAYSPAARSVKRALQAAEVEPSAGEAEPPTREELDGFLQTWGLTEECLLTLEGQSPDIQRRVLDQFHPKFGTRDVRSLFFGFLRSLAAGGGKRPRVV